jgi:RNA polymerase sigma-70 factor, ECF subfamily
VSELELKSLAECTRRIGELDATAQQAFAPTLYREMHAVAIFLLRNTKPGHTLQPTALVHEAWLKISNLEPDAERGRKQFLALAAKAMRSVLVDHARAKLTDRRGRGRSPETLYEVTFASEVDSGDLVDLDEVLEEFEQIDPTRARIVELIFFAGLSTDETADVLGVSKRTVERGWNIARAWLHGRLAERGQRPS